MGDCGGCGTGGRFAGANGADDKVVGIRSALRDGSTRIRVSRADRESGAGIEMVSSAAWAGDGLGVLGIGRGWSRSAAARQLFDSDVWMEACPRSDCGWVSSGAVSGGDWDYAIESG